MLAYQPPANSKCKWFLGSGRRWRAPEISFPGISFTQFGKAFPAYGILNSNKIHTTDWPMWTQLAWNYNHTKTCFTSSSGGVKQSLNIEISCPWTTTVTHAQAAGQGCALLRITMCFKPIRRGLPTIISIIMVGFYLQCAWRCPSNVPIEINSHRHTWNVDSTTLSLENAIHSPTRNLTANVITIPNNTPIQQDVKPCPETPPFLRKYLCALWSHFVDVE